jgi:hypothetical protein
LVRFSSKIILCSLVVRKIKVFIHWPSPSHVPNLFSSRPPVTRHLNIWSKYYSKVRAGILVMCLAWLEAQKPESQSPGFASQAKPNSGLDRGLGFGLRLVKPKPGLLQTKFPVWMTHE